MCGRFYIEQDDPTEELLAIIAEIERNLKDHPDGLLLKKGEIFPTDIVPAIIGSKTNQIQPIAMKWGFSKFDTKGVIINARSETALEKPMFQKPMLTRRCLIPASNYFEWQNVNEKKIKHAIYDPKSKLLYMAGCYRLEQNSPLPQFVILTKDAAPGIRYIHDRMPVILGSEAQHAWLGDNANITAILQSAMEDMIAQAV